MKILVTAFGPFGGRSDNASSLALQALRKSFPQIRTRILPVDASIAPARLKQAIRVVRPDALIMLGEAAGSAQIRLETTAWNELNFSIPDIAGRVIQSRPICENAPNIRKSTLPLAEVLCHLLAANHSVIFSDNAGRYLCNQVFYVALGYLEKLEIDIPAGFIHLPLESIYPTPRSADALGQVIRILNDRLGESQG